jgi:hypothetical protein
MTEQAADGPEPGSSGDEGIELMKSAFAGRWATMRVSERPRFVLEVMQILLDTMTETIHELREENAQLRAEVARLRPG